MANSLTLDLDPRTLRGEMGLRSDPAGGDIAASERKARGELERLQQAIALLSESYRRGITLAFYQDLMTICTAYTDCARRQARREKWLRRRN